MKKSLVIVESPAKAKTIAKILGGNYLLQASLGHVRDLPRSSLGVDIEHDFKPKYVVSRDKSKTVRDLKKAVKLAKTIYLATDPDREGEAIAWHLLKVTKINPKSFYRVVFSEITTPAIEKAFKAPRSIDMQLVNAQQARRVLDRLVGYKLSPLLWRKIRKGLSAGRVQSVTLKIIVDREREIEKFVSIEYWTIEAEFIKKNNIETMPFRAVLTCLADGTEIEINCQEEANEIKTELEGARYIVSKVRTKKAHRRPAPPFITSTLQQEAWRHFHLSAKQTMITAQQLYEGLPVGGEGSIGLITYMRTDSTYVARSAISETRDFISSKYGSEYLPTHARTFSKKIKAAQEAHEAIRPTSIWRHPSLIKQNLTITQFRLYNLIWQRMVASQMAAAIFDNTNVEIKAHCLRSKMEYLFKVSCSINVFPGFLVITTEDRLKNKETKCSPLPAMEKGDELSLLNLFPEQRFTQPPPRFTEASLIKLLEHVGIGRPSTYAPIVSVIQEREYIKKLKGNLVPTDLGFLVSDMLARYFAPIVNVEFTANLEDNLDKIANENLDWVQVVRAFYTPFIKDLENAFESIEKVKLADEETGEMCPRCNKPIVVKSGRFGKFLACIGFPECKYTASFQLKTGAKCPECGYEIIGKRNKNKRLFYGCSNYPNCLFATNHKPLSHPCPNCNSLLLIHRSNWQRCLKCDYKERLQD
ncbi:MAG: type I DNA topoisomerase [Dehalococcoidia bacterium]|nr:MAG: type I DNA topoisomerase [Dehalococcoidia bacterium]